MYKHANVTDIAYQLYDALTDLCMALHYEQEAKEPDEIDLARNDRIRAMRQAKETLCLACDSLHIDEEYRG